MVKVPESSLSPAALARAKSNGRYYNGFVYGTKGAADQARASVRGQGSNRGGFRGGRGGGRSNAALTRASATSPTSGWTTREVKVHTWSPVVSAADTLTRECLNLKLFGGGDHGTDVEGDFTDLDDKEILGIRLQVQYPAAQTLARFAAAIVDNDVDGDRTLVQVSAVSGAVINHDQALVDGWFAINMGGMKKVEFSTDDVSPTLRLFISFEQMRGDVTAATFKVHITYRSPGTSAPKHTL